MCCIDRLKWHWIADGRNKNPPEGGSARPYAYMEIFISLEKTIERNRYYSPSLRLYWFSLKLDMFVPE